jgi:uncharacterized protein (TIGR02145 family)
MKHLRILFSLAIFLTGLTVETAAQTDSITDIDGNVYQTIAIGTQWWMTENLKVSRYANGDTIPYLKQDEDWAASEEGAYCYYANRTNFIDQFGLLYNWYVAADEREVCPSGWHISTDEDWIILEKYLGMSAAETERMTAWRGSNEGDKLKDHSFGGNNSSGFTAFGTGYRDPEGTFKAMGTDNDYWTSTPYDNEGNTEGILHGLLNSKSSVVRNFHVPGYGFCIRCVRDEVVSAKEHKSRAGSLVYPNPAGDQLFIKNADGNLLTIRNLAGQVVWTEEVSSQEHLVDMSCLHSGTYLVSLKHLEETCTSRVIVL